MLLLSNHGAGCTAFAKWGRDSLEALRRREDHKTPLKNLSLILRDARSMLGRLGCDDFLLEARKARRTLRERYTRAVARGDMWAPLTSPAADGPRVDIRAVVSRKAGQKLEAILGAMRVRVGSDGVSEADAVEAAVLTATPSVCAQAFLESIGKAEPVAAAPAAAAS